MNAQKNHYNYEFHALMILKVNLLYFLCVLVVNYYGSSNATILSDPPMVLPDNR